MQGIYKPVQKLSDLFAQKVCNEQQNKMSKSYELVYFDGRARAEPIRLAFQACGIKFTDKRVSQEGWPKEKPNAPLGRLPYIVIKEGDKVLTQFSESRTILRYLGKELDFYAGTNYLQQAMVDQIIDVCIDANNSWEKAVFGDGDAKKNMETFKKESVPKFYDMLEKLLKGNKINGFAVGDRLSIADFMLLCTVDACGEENLTKYECLNANRKKVKENKKIAAYLSSRPQTKF